MYLYYYFNEKYVGTVDIEVMFASKNRSTLIVTDEKGANLLGSLELMYGKHIEKFNTKQAYALSRVVKLAPNVYTTSKVGPVLKWDDLGDTLCV